MEQGREQRWEKERAAVSGSLLLRFAVVCWPLSSFRFVCGKSSVASHPRSLPHGGKGQRAAKQRQKAEEREHTQLSPPALVSAAATTALVPPSASFDDGVECAALRLSLCRLCPVPPASLFPRRLTHFPIRSNHTQTPPQPVRREQVRRGSNEQTPQPQSLADSLLLYLLRSLSAASFFFVCHVVSVWR